MLKSDINGEDINFADNQFWIVKVLMQNDNNSSMRKTRD